MTNKLFWEIVDAFENSTISIELAIKIIAAANDGDLDKTLDDVQLLLKGTIPNEAHDLAAEECKLHRNN